MRAPKGTLLLAGLAAFAYYKYSKLSAEEKDSLVSDLKEKGKKLYDQYAPPELKDLFGKKQGETASQFSESETFTG